MAEKKNKFIWWNRNIAIMAFICFCLWLIMGKTMKDGIVYGTFLIYFACLAIWNMRASKARY